MESLKGGPEKPLSNTGRRNSKLQWRPRVIGEAHGKLHTEWRQSKRGAEFRWEEPEERTSQGSRAQIPGTSLQGSASAHLDFGLAPVPPIWNNKIYSVPLYIKACNLFIVFFFTGFFRGSKLRLTLSHRRDFGLLSRDWKMLWRFCTICILLDGMSLYGQGWNVPFRSVCLGVRLLRGGAVTV